MNDELARMTEDAESTPSHLPSARMPEGPTPARLALGIAAALLVALVSFFALGAHFSDPASFGSTVAVLDAKKDTVMSLIAASTGSSAAISLLPGDAGTPIAEKLVDLSSDFLVVLAAIYLEKYLLAIMGFASFKVLIPTACALAAAALLLWRQPDFRLKIMNLSARLVLFALVAVAVVPASVWVSGKIEDTYQASISETIQTAEQTTEAIEQSTAEGESSDSSNPLSFLTNMPDELNKLTESARTSLSNFVEALAVMIVTSCVIPILVLVFFLWLAKMILGVNISVPYPHPHSMRRHRP